MNNNIKNLLIFTAGVAVGAGGSYMALKSVFEVRYNEDVMQVREAYAEALNEAKTRSEGHSEASKQADISGDAANASNEPEEKEIKATRTVPLPDHKPDLEELVQKIDYTKYGKKGEDPSKPVVTQSNIEYIDCTEYDEEEDGYDKVTLTYFETEMIFMDNKTEGEVKNALQLIGGMETIDNIGMYQDDMVHVRNKANRTKYEIIREEDQTYHDYIYNFDGTMMTY